ncbi:DNA-binding response regulator, partial [Kocuria sp. CPCC 204721]
MNSGSDAGTRPERVLVVDDEKPLAQMVATYLSRAGYAVAQAHTGPAALETARTEH